MAGCPTRKIALDLQLADLAVQIVDDLLRSSTAPHYAFRSVANL
jgi:hypothetical protein